MAGAVSLRGTDPAVAPAALPRAERIAIIAALAGLSALSWAYLFHLGHGMSAGSAMSVAFRPWSAGYALLMFLMWWVMMLGMMLPSALPMILTFATVSRRQRAQGRVGAQTAVFVAGYLLAWTGFSAAATLLEWWLERAGLMLPMMHVTSPVLGGALFIAAGAYQWTPLKNACLRHCRSPFDFVLNAWRDGSVGALRMGMGHGMYCLGCCWLVMLLLFAGGVMNLLWVALIAGFVLLEKLLPAGRWVARAGGALSIAFGAWMIAH